MRLGLRLRSAAALVLLLPLAGCAGPGGAGGAADEAGVDDPGAPGNGTGAGGNASVGMQGLERLAFDAAEQDVGQVLEGTFPAGQGCIPLYGICDNAQRHDVTPMVPVGAPTQVVLTLEHDGTPGSLVGQRLEVEGGWFSYTDASEDEGSDELVAVALLEPGGTLTVVVQAYLPGLFPPQELRYTVAVRAVVRPGVLPVGLPIAVDLAEGEELAVEGSGVKDFVVVPPDGSPVHHTAVPFRFNASAETGGAGRHVLVLAADGDVALLGPPGRALAPRPILQHLGEPHAAGSGQDVAWEFTAPGIPLQVGLMLVYAETAGGWSVASGHGNHRMSIAREGAEILVITGEGCVGVCEMSPVSPAGSREAGYGAYLDERLGVGTYQAAARFETSNNMQVREIVYYVEP